MTVLGPVVQLKCYKLHNLSDSDSKKRNGHKYQNINIAATLSFEVLAHVVIVVRDTQSPYFCMETDNIIDVVLCIF